jgi:ABC-2 type transport system permease protein
VAAKLLAVAGLEVVQIVLLVIIAAAFGWRPAGSAAAAVGFLLLGTSAFAGLGLLLAGTMRAEATLAIANGVFLFFVLLGGLFVPLSHLPSGLAALARGLPAYALADVLRAGLSEKVHVAFGSSLVLAVWAVAAPLLAALTFRWE